MSDSETITSFPPALITPLVHEISKLLQSNNSTLAISEGSCGGLLSSYLVSQPGASKWYQGGTLLYSLNSRLKLNGWSRAEIQEYTGPSEKVALRLARNLRIELGSEYALSETGIAGGRVYKNTNAESGEVGVVFLAVSTPHGEFSKCVNTGSKERHVNMQLFAKLGLEFLLEILEKAKDQETEEKEEEANKVELEDIKENEKDSDQSSNRLKKVRLDE